MKRQIVLLLAAVLCTEACTTRKVITRPNPGAVVERVEVGDVIRIQARSGKIYAMKVTEVGNTYLRGYNAANHKRYKIPMSQVEKMQYEEFNGAKTAAAIGVGTVAMYTVTVLLVIAAFDAIGDSFGESFDNFFSGGC